WSWWCGRGVGPRHFVSLHRSTNRFVLMARRNLARAFCACFLAVAALVTVTAGRAFASGARARWRPSADSRVAGYRLYVRGVRAVYGPPIDVGLPRASQDG